MNTSLASSAETGHFEAKIATKQLEVSYFERDVLRYLFFLSLYGESLYRLGDEFAQDIAYMFSAEARDVAHTLYQYAYFGPPTFPGEFGLYFSSPGQSSIQQVMIDVIGTALNNRINYHWDPALNPGVGGSTGTSNTPVIAPTGDTILLVDA